MQAPKASPDVRVVFKIRLSCLTKAPILAPAAQQHILRTRVAAAVGCSLHTHTHTHKQGSTSHDQEDDEEGCMHACKFLHTQTSMAHRVDGTQSEGRSFSCLLPRSAWGLAQLQAACMRAHVCMCVYVCACARACSCVPRVQLQLQVASRGQAGPRPPARSISPAACARHKRLL